MPDGNVLNGGVQLTMQSGLKLSRPVTYTI